MTELLKRLRTAVGRRLFWCGFKMMPKTLRCRISTIVDVGLQWSRAEPEKFDELAAASLAGRPHKLVLVMDETRIEYGDTFEQSVPPETK